MSTIWTPDNSYLLEYRGRCQTGEILIGQELMMELDNLAEDIASGLYVYDRSDALLRMDFMEGCIRLTKSPYYNQPMRLMLWQRAFTEATYSFKMPDTGFRRFQKVILLIARKNTKSETCSALGLCEFFLGPPGADIVASSNDDSQASIIYDAIDTMRLLVDPDGLDTHRNQRHMLNRITNTKIFKLSDKTRNKEGRNIDTAFLDESHEMRENVIAKSIEQSQSIKDEPLFFNLTTEGFVTDGYLDQELRKARAVIARESPDSPAAKRLLPWLYTQDSEMEVWEGNRENRLWEKSNPTLGIVKKYSYLEQQVEEARNSKPDRIFVLCKDFNIKQSSAQAWLDLRDYDYPCQYDIEQLRGGIAIGAVDLAETTDMVAAKALVMRPGDGRMYVVSHYWIPESKLADANDRTAGAEYEAWAAAGHMTISPGADVDLAEVADWYWHLYTDYDIRLWRCGYDQRFCRDWIARMDTYGWSKSGGDDSDLVMVAQNAQTLSNAVRLTESELKHRRIWYGCHPVDKWCLGNAGIKVDDHNFCLVVKMQTSKRIDGAVCLVILMEMYRRYRTDYKAAIGDDG